VPIQIVAVDPPAPVELRAFLTAAWHADFVVAHGERIQPARLPAFVAMDGTRIAGHASYRVAGGTCELTSIVAEPRGRGIGSRLLDAVLAVAREAGCVSVWLTTTNDNLGALRFYQRHGFRLRALRPGAVDEARRSLKPQIPATGAFGIPLRDELDLKLDL